MRAQITLHSGAQIEVDVEEITYQPDRRVPLEWTDAPHASRALVLIESTEIAAIVLVSEVSD